MELKSVFKVTLDAGLPMFTPRDPCRELSLLTNKHCCVQSYGGNPIGKIQQHRVRKQKISNRTLNTQQTQYCSEIMWKLCHNNYRGANTI